MAVSLRLRILTQRGVHYDNTVQSVRLPGTEGFFGVRPGHAAMISALGEGPISIRESATRVTTLACTGGVAEVTGREIVILADGISGPAKAG